jgi:hypothetical protein
MFTQSFFPADYFAPRYFSGPGRVLPGTPIGTAWLSNRLVHGAALFESVLAQGAGSTSAAGAVLQGRALGNGELSRRLMAEAGAQAAGAWKAMAAHAARSETSTLVRLIDGAALAWSAVDEAEAEDAERAAVEKRASVL